MTIALRSIKSRQNST